MPVQSRRPMRTLPLAYALLACLAALIVMAHLGLIGSGAWLGDEYFNFAMSQQSGWRFFVHRVLTWSPRPVSEIEIYFYFRAVTARAADLIVPFLGLFWAAALAATLAGWRRRGDGVAGLAVPLAIFALFVLAPAVNEMFYWPMGASPYLGGLACVAFATLGLARARGDGAHDQALIVTALVLAAGHTELGLLFGLTLCPLLMVDSARVGQRTQAAVWAVPVIVGFGILAVLTFGRMAQPADPSIVGGGFYHHLWPSAGAALPVALGDLSGRTAGAVIARLLFGCGMAVCISRMQGFAAPTRLAALAAALLATIYLSIVAAYYQDGLYCCERHATFRHCLVVLLLVVVAVLVAQWPGVRRRLRGRAAMAGPVLLAASLVVILPARMAGLAHDYAIAAESWRARAETWRSAGAAGAAMIFHTAPDGQVVATGHLLMPGGYRLADHPLWYVWGVLRFFHKAAMTVTAG